jgi:hypothetical protein
MLGIEMHPLHPTVLPTESQPITPYCEKLLMLKELDGITELKKYRVVRVRAFKSRAASRPEYVCATVVDSKNETTLVAIERGRGNSEHITNTDSNTDSNNQVGLQPKQSSSSSCSNLSIHSVSSLSDSSRSPACLANDKISPIRAERIRNSDDDLICDLDFEKTQSQLHLYELAVLGDFVHKGNTSYMLFSNNCYHYAGTITKVLGTVYGIPDSTDGAGAGKWCGIPIHSIERSKVASLVEGYRKHLEVFVSFTLIN